MLRIATSDIESGKEQKRILDIANEVAKKTITCEMRAFRLKRRFEEYQVILSKDNEFYINLRYRKGSLIVLIGAVGNEKRIQHILFKAGPETIAPNAETDEDENNGGKNNSLGQIVKSDMSSEHRKILLSLLQNHDPSDSKIDFASTLVKIVRVSLAKRLPSSGNSSWQCAVSLKSDPLCFEGDYDQGTFANVRVGKWRLIVWRAHYTPQGRINYPNFENLIYIFPLITFGYFLYLNNTCTSYCTLSDESTSSHCTVEQQQKETLCEDSKQFFAQASMYTVIAVGAIKFIARRWRRANLSNKKKNKGKLA